ncbi:S8/S53 family peptidase [Actinopolymorpha pittospori]|uniref:Subtilisin family serine protease n=1 Tax=Actinopolymorpha pittospori TaxID=648752 RepID=A0A927MR09_9ACTN|nr:S8/S53 family peptidase [Actinopolymorpha pittospori]MBE1604514.1 subtilisin family serine protease [Actinopolymorpha pittospori]
MKVWFRAESPDQTIGGKGEPRATDVTTGAIPFSAAVLDRHRARVLRPGEAVLAPKQPTPRPTAYRSDVLLVPHEFLTDPDLTKAITEVLSKASLEPIVPVDPAAPNPSGPRRPRQPLSRFRAQMPRPLRLRARADAPPMAVDAWAALQTLRAAADTGQLSKKIVDRIGLEHLLVGSALVGAGGASIGGVNVATEGSTPIPGGVGSYTLAGYGGRMPVDIVLAAPPRRRAEELPGQRRRVVAVLDSGLQPTLDSWIDIDERWTPGDPVASVDSAFQQMMTDYGTLAADPDVTGPAIDGPWDGPYTAEPLVGEVTTHFGHGTFIAGIIRQVAPDAHVRSIRVMHSDGVVEEGLLLAALHLLAEEVEGQVAAGGPLPVDVVSLSLGYFDEGPADQVTPLLAGIIADLAALGVVVVAAAGNYATTRPFYPAAFSDTPPDEAVPILSVGALNPNGTVALFSNDGPWVTCWATGAAVLSTFPVMPSGSEQAANAPVQQSAGLPRQTLDPDDFTSGFAVWSGTSFAAPLVAAKVALALQEGADSDLVRADVHDPANVLAKVVAAAEGRRKVL